ncbi:hypothetical protein CALCODRAFT_483149 [Calocera cornea HHB12733]|uniref:PCI domain-containing protein n=1 Tax=Calocera cornea HHB12733 TaxID=1353952 RepID=A0A165G172_9BASI|nr:hypothetical protein CALCODRAFT_483149 [Calocera cornea HHB12733]
MSARGRYIPPALRQRTEEYRRRERAGMGKPLDRMERLAMISRSGGSDDDNDTLKDFKIQEDFQEYIDKHISAYQAANAFPPPLNDDGTSSLSPSQLETLTNILIMLRKLREGILASQRVDRFAVEAYEMSARLAVYCQEDKALSSVFGHLVPDLYDEADEAMLTTGLLYLTTGTTPAAPNPNGALVTSNRDEFTAVYLLHLLHTAYPSQQDFLSRLKDLSPPTSATFQLVAVTAAYVRRGNFWALSQLVLRPSPIRSDLVQRMLIVILAKTRSRTWATLKAAYMQLQLDRGNWLCSVLGFEKAATVEVFMKERAKQGEVVKKDATVPTWTIQKAAKGKS